jgi:hypothetical protein
MAIFELEANGKVYEVDAPDQAAALSAFQGMQKPEGNALTDIVPEIKGAFNENLTAFKQGFGLEGPRPGEKGAVEGIMGVGKGLLAIPGMAAAPVTGAARSLMGHPLAAATQFAGSFIDQERTRNESYKDVYEQSKAGVDQAMMAMAPRGASPVGRVPLDKTPDAAALIRSGKDAFEKNKAVPVPARDMDMLSAKIENDLLQSGFRPGQGNAPGAFSEIKNMKPRAPSGPSRAEQLQAEMNWEAKPAPAPAPDMDLAGLRAIRRSFNETAKQVGPDFKPTADATAARRAIGHIDDYIDGISPEIRAANADYAAGKRAQMLDFRTIRADKEAAKAGSGSNMENRLRSAVDKIGDRGLSKQEIAARDKIVTGSVARNALRKVGKLGVSDGLSLMLHSGAAAGSGGATVPIAVAGTVARKIGEILTRAEIAALNKSIRTRSPLAQALASKPQYAKIPKGAKAIAAALLSEGPKNPTFAGILPAYAEQDKR